MRQAVAVALLPLVMFQSASPATVNNLLNLVTSSTASSSLQSADLSLIDRFVCTAKISLIVQASNQEESVGKSL